MIEIEIIAQLLRQEGLNVTTRDSMMVVDNGTGDIGDGQSNGWGRAWVSNPTLAEMLMRTFTKCDGVISMNDLAHPDVDFGKELAKRCRHRIHREYLKGDQTKEKQ